MKVLYLAFVDFKDASYGPAKKILSACKALEALKSFDLFLLPSLFEGLPLVGIEAQAAGLPMVASDTVTPETDITGNVTFLSLDLPAEVWARKILDVCSDFERVDMTEAVRNAGYDIKQTTQWLQRFYIEKGEI